MGPLAVAALIGGGLEVAGGIASNAQSRAMSREQMRFQERMSSTAHQREVEDLRKAGLNPLLSANAGASSPGGAMGETRNVASGVASSVKQAMMLKNEMDVLKAQKDKLMSERDSVDLDNFRKRALYGMLEPGKGGVSAIEPNSALAAEISSVKAMSAANLLGLSEREATAKMWEQVGTTGKGMQFLVPFLRMILGGK